mgnify:CR=1 FL=1
MSLPASGQALLDRLELFGVRLGLETTHHLLEALGNPHRQMAAVLVAGTNGKGSTSALLAAMISAAGYRSGLYSSPHLEEVGERVRIDGRAIAPEVLAALLEEVVAAGERVLGAPPTYFEALTAAAFLHFARQGVELAVLEVGMGGRLDATNACEPLVSVITSISLDHVQHLGTTLAAIAGEKAGILRAGRPAVIGTGAGEAEAAVLARARDLGCRLCLAREAAAVTWGPGDTVRLETGRGGYLLPAQLPGAHQRENLALAVLAAEELAALGYGRLDRRAITRGAAVCHWPGRLERVDLPGGRSLLLDAAHNPGGAATLAAHLASRGEPYHLLFGCFADKEATAMLPPLAAGAHAVTLTRAPSPRSEATDRLAALLAPGRPSVVEIESLPEALDRALAGPVELVVATGSLYLVGEVRKLCRARFGVPAAASAPLWELGPEALDLDLACEEALS